MTFTDPAKYGAAFAARRSQNNPRQLLIGLIEGDPSAEKDRQWRCFVERIQEEDGVSLPADGYAMSCLHEVFIRAWDTLNRVAKVTRESPQKRVERQRMEQVKVAEIKAKVIQFAWLQMVMPNGKEAGDCTGTEMVAFGGKFAKIGHKVGKKRVRDVLTEKQVRAIVAS